MKIILKLTSLIKKLSLTHFVLIVKGAQPEGMIILL